MSVVLGLLGVAVAGAAEPAYSPHENGLALGVSVDDKRRVELLLQNVGDAPLAVWSHAQSGPTVHLDWFELRLVDPLGNTRVARFLDARGTEAAPVKVHLAPGETVRHAIDLDAWLTKPVNGGRALDPGKYGLTAVYEVGIDGAWNGRLLTAALDVPVPDADGIVPVPVAEPTYVLEGDLLGDEEE